MLAQEKTARTDGQREGAPAQSRREETRERWGPWREPCVFRHPGGGGRGVPSLGAVYLTLRGSGFADLWVK